MDYSGALALQHACWARKSSNVRARSCRIGVCAGEGVAGRQPGSAVRVHFATSFVGMSRNYHVLMHALMHASSGRCVDRPGFASLVQMLAIPARARTVSDVPLNPSTLLTDREV